jgi:hypothetical protein
MFGNAFGGTAIHRPRNPHTSRIRKKNKYPELKMNWKKIGGEFFGFQKFQKYRIFSDILMHFDEILIDFSIFFKMKYFLEYCNILIILVLQIYYSDKTVITIYCTQLQLKINGNPVVCNNPIGIHKLYL